MDLSKFLELFNPSKITGRIHIIGCGSVGSTLAELLARYGLTKFDLYDFDIVEAKNVANQMFREIDVGKPKVKALKEILCEINSEVEKDVVLHGEGYTNQPLSGYVFLAVDDIELRREICEKNQYNIHIKSVIDVRTALYDAETRAADWSSFNDKKAMLDSMQFSNEDADKATPRSACGVTFGVAPTVRMVCTLAVTNFMNFLANKKMARLIIAAPFQLEDGPVTVVM